MTITTAAFDLDLARRAHEGTSHTPDVRAEQERQDFEQQIASTWTYLSGFVQTSEQRALLAAEMVRYREGSLRRTNAWLMARSRTISVLVTGPANFPTARNQKRLDTEQRRHQELVAWQREGQRRIKRALLALEAPAPVPDPNAPTGEDEIASLPGLHAVRNHDANRLQLFFDGKPDDATRQQLKSSGWHWSPTSGAWQRKITPNAEYALARFLEGRA